MKSNKNVPEQLKKSTAALERALRGAHGGKRLRNLTLCGTVDGVVTIVGQLRTDWPECRTVNELLEKLSWGSPC